MCSGQHFKNVKGYYVEYFNGGTKHQTPVVKLKSTAKRSSKRIHLNELVTSITIYGILANGGIQLVERLRCSCPKDYHQLFMECRGY